MFIKIIIIYRIYSNKRRNWEKEAAALIRVNTLFLLERYLQV